MVACQLRPRGVWPTSVRSIPKSSSAGRAATFISRRAPCWYPPQAEPKGHNDWSAALAVIDQVKPT